MTAIFILRNLYNENKDRKSPEEIKLLIAKAINTINYESDKTYFFINSNKGQAVLFNKKIEDIFWLE